MKDWLIITSGHDEETAKLLNEHSEEVFKELKAIFHEDDLDKDGMLSEEEMKGTYKRIIRDEL